MPEPLAFKDGLQYAWDSTSIKLASECLYKYKLKMIDGWDSQSLSVHLWFGQHYATALEHFHKYRAQGRDWQEALEDVVLETLVGTWDYNLDDFGNAVPGSGAARIYPLATGSGAYKTRENLIRTIVWYLDQFRDDPMSTLILGDGSPAVEYSFALPVDDDIVFAGHIDRLVNYADGVYVTDNKTTGSTISQKYFSDFKPDVQMSMYTFAGKIIYNLPVKGVVIDAAQIAVGFTRFERGMTMRSDSELTEWYDETMQMIERARSATRERRFPRNPTACGNYGGCMYRAACSRSPEVREQMLKADYVKGIRWDPLKTR